MSKVVVLFEVKPTEEGMQRYLDLAGMLKPMLARLKPTLRPLRVLLKPHKLLLKRPRMMLIPF